MVTDKKVYNGRKAIWIIILAILILGAFYKMNTINDMSFENEDVLKIDLVTFSEQLLLAVKKNEDTDSISSELNSISFSDLTVSLDSDARKKAFWINIYNAFYQILRADKEVEKSGIYKAKKIPIAGRLFSLDEIEHGILRRYRYKFSLGYLPNPFTSKNIKRLAVSEIDYRIHFALNCGAASCPPIAFYSEDKIDQQLELAMLSFLEQETVVIKEKMEIHITRLFQWFLGDFGGKKGVRRILNEKLNIETAGMKLIYRDYDWSDDLHNFVD